MRLERNINADGFGKYSLVNHKKDGELEHGMPGTKDEFFVIKLKDLHAKAALLAYAKSAEFYDSEYAADIRDLAARAGRDNVWCKFPD